MAGVEDFSSYWLERHVLGLGDNFRNIVDWESHRGISHWGTWTGCIVLHQYSR